jgi:hypothetical protein
MSIARAGSVVSKALLALVLALVGLGSAQAAVYSGRWDPAYGGTFASLGWEASALFNVPDTCLALGNSGGIIAPTGSCAGFSVLSAQIGLYNIAAPGTILESFALSTDVNVTGIRIAGGQLTGVDTGFFDSIVPSLGIAGGGDYSFSLILFGGDKAQLIYAKPKETSPACAQFPVPGTSCGQSLNPAVGVFAIAPIPEPETYALLLAGLAAIGFIARRRRR